ncbi:MAG TPA: hypothetical protein VIQ04_06070 [Nitrososphaeraceae archaeon]
MIEISDKKYKCPYCSQTSSRKYNIDIHTQRKHQRTLVRHLNQRTNPYFSDNIKELNQFLYDLNSAIEQPSSFPHLSFVILIIMPIEKMKKKDNQEGDSIALY